MLDAALDRILAGSGQMVILEGGAGAGKSTLLTAARESARAAGFRVLDARGGELEREFPFGGIRQLYELAVVSADEPERARLLAGSAAPAAWVLGLSASGSGIHAAGFTAMHAIYWLTALRWSSGGIASRAPRVGRSSRASASSWAAARASLASSRASRLAR